MWIGYLSFFSDWHTETEIADYLEFAGHEVWRYHYTKVDQQKFLEKDFDLVITALPQAFPLTFWDQIKCPKVAWYFDWIQGWGQREQQYLPIVKHFDLILSTDGFENPIYNGMNRHWLPHAVDTRVYKPDPNKAAIGSDCAFIGHCYTPYRRRLLQNLQREFNFSWMGNAEECWGPKYAEACASTKIVVGDNCRNDIPGYWSDRLYLSLACEAFLLYPNVPGIPFKDGEHLVLYTSEEDLHQKIKHFLAAPEERARIARAGASHAARYHSWEIRVAEALEFIKEIL